MIHVDVILLEYIPFWMHFQMFQLWKFIKKARIYNRQFYGADYFSDIDSSHLVNAQMHNDVGEIIFDGKLYVTDG